MPAGTTLSCPVKPPSYFHYTKIKIKGKKTPNAHFNSEAARRCERRHSHSLFHLKIRAHPTPEKPTGFTPKINRESETRERLLHPLPPRSTGGGGEDRQRWLSHTFQNSAGRSALPLYLESRLFRAGSIPPLCCSVELFLP